MQKANHMTRDELKNATWETICRHSNVRRAVHASIMENRFNHCAPQLAKVVRRHPLIETLVIVQASSQLHQNNKHSLKPSDDGWIYLQS